MQKSLSGYVCLVTGATRGLGKAIAVALGEAGATVYITGRTLDSPYRTSENGLESLTETARIITESGGKAIPVAVDHSDDSQVAGLFARIRREQAGRLDVLVNNAFAATDYLLTVGGPDSVYWEPSTNVRSPCDEWDLVNRVGLRNAYTCCVLATRLMIECRSIQMDGGNHISPSPMGNRNPKCVSMLPTGLIVNISSIAGTWRIFNVAYCVGKCAVDRMSIEMSRDLTKRGVDVAVLSLIPGVIRTETVVAALESGAAPAMLTQAFNLHLDIPAEVPAHAIALLVGQPREHLTQYYSGRCVFSDDLIEQFGLRKPDGTYPNNCRALKTLLQLAGWRRLAYLVPQFIKVPLWALAIMTSKF